MQNLTRYVGCSIYFVYTDDGKQKLLKMSTGIMLVYYNTNLDRSQWNDFHGPSFPHNQFNHKIISKL